MEFGLAVEPVLQRCNKMAWVSSGGLQIGHSNMASQDTSDSAPKHHASAKVPPGERIPYKEKAAYGFGNIATALSELDRSLLGPIFVLQLGLAPSLMSTLGLIYRLWDAITDALVGWMSDNFRSRWGRRKPFLLAGTFLMALWAPVIYFLDPSWPKEILIAWMIGCMLVMFLVNTIFNIPYQCLLLEMTPNSVERTNVTVWRSYIGQIGIFFGAWIWALVSLPVFGTLENGQPDIVNGARWVMSGVGVLIIIVGLMPVLFVRERFAHVSQKQPKHSLWKNMQMTFTNRIFVLFIAITVLYSLGNNIDSTLNFFTIVYHACSGDNALAAQINGYRGTAAIITTLLTLPLFRWYARRYGKHSTIVLTLGLLIFSNLSTLVLYTPSYPYLAIIPGILTSPAIAGIWVILPSLTGDVVDYDELQTGERREGAFVSIFSWVLKLAWAVATFFAGFIVEWAGYHPDLRDAMPAEAIQNYRYLNAFVPLIFLVPGLILAARFPLTAEVIEANRRTLEERRGKL